MPKADDMVYFKNYHKRLAAPLAPEKMKVTKEMLSPYCESIREKFNISID